MAPGHVFTGSRLFDKDAIDKSVLYMCNAAGMGGNAWTPQNVSFLSDCEQNICKKIDANPNFMVDNYYLYGAAAGSSGVITTANQGVPQTTTNICKCSSDQVGGGSGGGSGGGITPASFECPEAELIGFRTQKVYYTGKSAAIVTNIDEILAYCAKTSGKDSAQYERMKADLSAMINRYEKEIADAEKKRKLEELNQKIVPLAKQVEALKNSIVEQLSKDAQADYQKKRLIADSVAGVALGAGGGFLVNKVVKNKQLKKGFDSISCKVGDTVVGEWGDEFGIGYNR